GGDGDGGSAVWHKPGTSHASRTIAITNVEKPTIASTLRAASIRNKALAAQATAISPRGRPPPAGGAATDRRPVARAAPPTAKPATATERAWAQRRLTAGAAAGTRRDSQHEAKQENQSSAGGSKLLEMGVQTNEAEILNHELLVGDIKLLMPSAQIADEIDKMRWKAKNSLDRQSVRRFGAHEQQEELHLDELKEFMERSYVTRRKPKKVPALLPTHDHQYGNVFKSMDEFFVREIPKAESITNIKERIRRKEIELMSMFDEVSIDQ
ncbi:hypothetical protein KR222_000544, partial [Zaprionus bogoriensis]